MIWGAIAGAGASLLGGAMSKGKGSKYKFRPFDVNAGPLGSVDMTKGGQMNVTEGAFGQEARGAFENMFRQAMMDPTNQVGFGQNLMMGAMDQFMPTFDAAQQAGYGRTEQATGGFLQDLQGLSGQFQGIGQQGMASLFGAPSAQGFAGMAGNAAMGLLGQTDLNQLAQDRTAQLTALARPGEETATNQKFQNLFSKGQLGTTGGAQALGQLQQAQQQAATQRGLAGMDFAEQIRQANLANAQGFLGQGMQGIGLDQAMARAQGQIGAGFLGQLPDMSAMGLGAVRGLDEAQVSRAQERMRNMEGLFGFGSGMQTAPAADMAKILGAMNPLDANMINLQNLALQGAGVRSGQSGGGGSAVGSALQGLGTGLFNQSMNKYFS